ncbi:MAG: hypothetical protein AMS22_05290 [Thiotrichales bacterium SG8_50]|nr:MAG: hypothetical protein AMS22_05290 [Thiotrichales bacterium SG8_50]
MRTSHSSQTNSRVESALASLCQAYAHRLPDKLARVEQLWHQLITERWSKQHLVELIRLVHNLVGSGRTFGFATLSAVAREFETRLNAVRVEPPTPGDPRLVELTSMIEVLKVSSVPAPRRDESICDADLLSARAVTAGGPIYVVDDDIDLCQYLTSYLTTRGYDARGFSHIGGMYAAVRRERPSAVVLDIMFPEGNLFGIDAVANLRALCGSRVPVLFLSARTDVAARLRAFRAGGDAYLTKPVDLDELAGRLTSLCAKTPEVRSRVLVIDDDLDLARHYQLRLGVHGFDAEVVSNPLQAMSKIIAFGPDLILLDVNMPDVSGLELAGVIRQHPRLANLPVVFVSGDADPETTAQASSIGGDAFIVKPVVEYFLVETIRERIRRAREVRHMIAAASQHQPGSNLANRRYFLQELENALAESTDSGPSRTLIYLTIDQFEFVRNQVGTMGLEALTQEIVKRVYGALGEPALVGQLDDGTFSVLTGLVLVDAADEQANLLRESVCAQPVEHNGHRLALSCSTAVLPLRASLRNVAHAFALAEQMVAQGSPRGQAAVSQAVDAPVQGDAHASVEEAVLDALNAYRIKMVFQPILNLEDHEEETYEVQLRLLDEAGGWILPAQFMPVAREHGWLQRLDRWKFERAIERLTANGRASASARFVIKLSGEAVSQGGFLPWFSNCLTSSRIRSDQQVIVEVEEADLMMHAELMLRLARMLHSVRSQLCIDKFGTTEHSSQLLGRVKPDLVKIGRPYISDWQSDRPTRERFRTLVHEACESGAQVIVEAVDTAASIATLWGWGVRRFQGYYIEEAHDELDFDFARAVKLRDGD